MYLKRLFVSGRLNTDEGEDQSFKFLAALIILGAVRKEYNAEKIAECSVGTKMRIRRNLINRVSSLFLRTRRASSMMEKCAREHISEVVPLSSWSLKKSRAPAGSREMLQEVEEI